MNPHPHANAETVLHVVSDETAAGRASRQAARDVLFLAGWLENEDGAARVENEKRLAAEARVERLEEALRIIGDNAESWHAGDDGKARALAVIAKWARDPKTIPVLLHPEEEGR